MPRTRLPSKNAAKLGTHFQDMSLRHRKNPSKAPIPNQVSVDSLNDKLAEKEEEVVVAAASNNAEAERLAQEAEFFKERLREAEELLNRYKTDNMMLHQRVEMAERDRGASEHGNYVELEKVREEYQEKLNELSQYPEKLSSAEARYQHAEAQSEALNSQLADKNQTVEELQKKIDLFQGQIGKLKTKIHAVNEDNIELSNKSQSHERKVLEADLHNKNLMDLVSKKDDAVEAHQVRSHGAATSTESTAGAYRDEVQIERDKNGPSILSGYPTNFPPHCPANFPLNPSHSAEFTNISNEVLDKDKSLTSRARHAVHTRTSPSHQGNQYHSSSPLAGPYDSCDPRLLDSYILSRLHFEEFLRSQTDLFHQMLVEREKALSVKSDSVAATPRERLAERAGSSQSEILPHYSTPWKVGSARSDHSLLNPPKLGNISDNGEFERAGSTYRDPCRQKTHSSELPTRTHRYFDKSNSNIVRTSSLTELEHLVDNCIMPEEVLTREPTPPPPFIRVTRQYPGEHQSGVYPVVPRGRAVSPDDDSDDKHQMMLGGVLSMPHATKYVDERTTRKLNGHHLQNGHDSPESHQDEKTKSKSSLFPWTKGSKNKNKSKGKKNGEPVAAT